MAHGHDAEAIANALAQLRRAGWSIGSTAGALVRAVSGVNGENVIRAEGTAERQAWQAAIEQARWFLSLRPDLTSKRFQGLVLHRT